MGCGGKRHGDGYRPPRPPLSWYDYLFFIGVVATGVLIVGFLYFFVRAVISMF